MNKQLNLASELTLAATLVLFILALFLKGFSHDVLLEAGVFLVSVKLIIGAKETHIAQQIYLGRLTKIEDALSRLEKK